MTQQYQIIYLPTGLPVGEPGTAGQVSDRCTELNDQVSPDPEKLRVIAYRVERLKQKIAQPSGTQPGNRF